MMHMPVSEGARRATLNMLPLGAFESGPDGSWDFVTPALVSMLGNLPVSSLLGREWLARVHPDDFSRVVAEYRQAREFGRPWHQNFRLLNAEGTAVPVGVDAVPLPQDPESRGVRYVGLVRDRSSVARAVAQQNESFALVQRLLEATHEGVLINRVDVTVAANTAAARILGFDRAEDLVGQAGRMRVHPDDLERAMAMARSADDTVTTARFLRKDGTAVVVALQGQQISYAGAPARLVTFVPIDDPLVNTAMVARTELRLSTLEHLLQLPYHRIGLEGDDAGRILATNVEFADLLGRTPDELVGMHFTEFTHPDDIAESIDSLQAFTSSAGRQGATLRKRLLRKDGSAVLVDLRSALFRDPVTGRMEGLTLTTELSPPPCCRELSATDLEQCRAFIDAWQAAGGSHPEPTNPDKPGTHAE